MADYKKISEEFLKDLPQKQKEILERRFGLKTGKRESLEGIGKNFGVTRERIRQIENRAILNITPRLVKYQKIFDGFKEVLKKEGGVKREDRFFSQMTQEKEQNYVFFLLTVSKKFYRYRGNNIFYPFWALNKKLLLKAKEKVIFFQNFLQEQKRLLSLKELSSLVQKEKLQRKFLLSCLEISKTILRSEDGLYGLKGWSEVNPKSIKDKAYSVLKKVKKPLHFTEVAKFIDSPVSIHSVHNELIKDPRFVLMGRGTYGLREWGIYEGTVKDVIWEILKKEKKPLSRDEILKRVLKHKLVKLNTIYLNLNQYFSKTPDGKYTLPKVKEA